MTDIFKHDPRAGWQQTAGDDHCLHPESLTLTDSGGCETELLSNNFAFTEILNCYIFCVMYFCLFNTGDIQINPGLSSIFFITEWV